MKLSSPNFENNSPIPFQYTCQGQNTSPQLDISNVPSEAKSLALLLDDPDATNGEFNHWTIWNIPPDTKTIKANVGPSFAVQGQNGASQQGFTGPCPPTGVHRYFFKLYALREMLDLPTTANKIDLEKAMKGKVIGQVQLMGTYKKTR